MTLPRLRVARPTRALDPLLRFYRDGLGLHVIGGFEDHEGFDGVMLGEPGGAWHLEFTVERGAAPGGAPSPEHLLVLYVPEPAAHAAVVARMAELGHAPVTSHNPYWDRCGVTFADPDGYRVVVVAGAWGA